MLNNIRKFAKTKFAGILIGLIIIPFVFWGMGGTFSSGNKNNLASLIIRRTTSSYWLRR